MMVEHTCELCELPAVYTDSVPDPANSRQGEAAYRVQYLCIAHAASRRLCVGNTARLEKLEESED